MYCQYTYELALLESLNLQTIAKFKNTIIPGLDSSPPVFKWPKW